MRDEAADSDAADAAEAVDAAPGTAPVLAVMVCHDGEPWLPLALTALRRSTVRPARIVAVDTGSDDKTQALLTEAAESGDPIIDGALTVPRETGFAAAVAAGVQLAEETFDDRVQWLWVLHDDSAPEPDCLADLLNAADASPSAAVVGPLTVDWSDPRLIVEAGLSTDASGNRRNDRGLDHAGGAGPGEPGPVEQSTEVLAMPSAGSLVDRQLWADLGGYEEDFGLLREDLDFGWRANAAGKTVLCVPRARLRHARALVSGERDLTALAGRSPLAVDRCAGLRTFLVNCRTPSYFLGIPRLLLLSLLRGIGFFVIGSGARAGAEFAAFGYLLRGHGQLKAGRHRRAAELRRLSSDGKGRRHGVRGLFVGRLARLRYAVRGAVLNLVRRRMASEMALGRLPESASAESTRSTWTPADELRAAAFPGGRTRDVVAVPLETADAVATAPVSGARHALPGDEPGLAGTGAGRHAIRRPTPGAAAGGGGLVFVEVDRKRILAATLFTPGLLLAVAMTALALAVNWNRLGLDLTGGRLLPVGSLAEMWSEYLTSWHPSGGGSTANAPVALAVLGTFGAPLVPLGGPAALVALLFLLDIPLAALSAYAASRRLRVHRWVRALLAATYAVLPPATAAVAQGRLDVVAVHILLPLVLAGVVAVLHPETAVRPENRDGRRWLSTAVGAALGLALLGAFSPLVHVLVLVGLLTVFVFTHSPVRMTRRIAGVAVVALLPIALLLPWPTTVVQHPELLLHGIGARVAELPVSGGELFSLDPGGVGTLPLGAILVVAALVGLIVRPTMRALTGVGIVLLGAGAAAAVVLIPLEPAVGGAARHGWAGAPLLVVGIGLLAMLLAVTHTEPGAEQARSRVGLTQRLAVGVAVGGLVVFAAAAVLVGRNGPLRSAETVAVADPIAAELQDTGRYVLELRNDGDPPRVSGGGMPAFGDDDLPLPAGSAQRLSGWQDVLLTAAGPPNAVRDTVASASAAGVQFIVLPPGVSSAGIIQGGGELITTAAPLADGRQLVRLKPTGGQVVLIAPELSKLAVGGKPPTGDIEGEGISVVAAGLPDVRLRVSDGPGGRLLVLAATHEAGWSATVNGKPVPIVPAWGYQVGVEVPTRAADVVVDTDNTARSLLLLGQVGAVLFTLLTAIPARQRKVQPGQSRASGSMPR